MSPTPFRAIVAHGFAGGFALGIIRAGFDLIGNLASPEGFGARLMEANRHLLPGPWLTIADNPGSWPVLDAELVFGNPKCSAFSSLSVHDPRRGIGSPDNQGMFDIIDYAAEVGPEVVIFESVAAAGTTGLPLMVDLRDRLEQRSHRRYDLTLVYQDNASVGGCSIRKRVFWVASRVPFGIEPPAQSRVPSLQEVIGDLAGQALAWEGDPDGHMVRATEMTRQIAHVASIAGDTWAPGESVGDVVQRLEREGHDMSETMATLWRTDPGTSPIRWAGDRPARVITGHALERVIHPWLPRTITYREAARIMGFPDTWSLHAARGVTESAGWLGKGVSVPAAEWIGAWAARAIEGNPGWLQGKEIGDRVREISVTHSWKHADRPGLWDVVAATEADVDAARAGAFIEALKEVIADMPGVILLEPEEGTDRSNLRNWIIVPVVPAD